MGSSHQKADAAEVHWTGAASFFGDWQRYGGGDRGVYLSSGWTKFADFSGRGRLKKRVVDFPQEGERENGKGGGVGNKLLRG